MPVTYELDQDAGLVVTRCWGAVNLEEVLHHFVELESDPRLPSRLDVLLDLSESATAPDTRQLQTIAARIQELETTVRWGALALVASVEMLIGLSQMLELFARGRFATFRTFRDQQEAWEWLGSPRSDVGPAG